MAPNVISLMWRHHYSQYTVVLLLRKSLSNLFHILEPVIVILVQCSPVVPPPPPLSLILLSLPAPITDTDDSS